MSNEYYPTAFDRAMNVLQTATIIHGHCLRRMGNHEDWEWIDRRFSSLFKQILRTSEEVEELEESV